MRVMPSRVSAAVAPTHVPAAVAPTHAPAAPPATPQHVPVAATLPPVATVLSHVPGASRNGAPSLLEIYHRELSDQAATIDTVPTLLSHGDDAGADEDVGSYVGVRA
jgi:hypothetical protein